MLHTVSRTVRPFAGSLPILGALFFAGALSDPLQGQSASDDAFSRIRWTEAGVSAALGNVAQLHIPENCRFTDEQGSKLFDEANENLPTPGAIGVLFCDLNPPDDAEARYWYAQYQFRPDGYVKDAAKEKLDAVAILKSFREGTAAGNEERSRRGWATMEIDGWEREPFYDTLTSNATWALRGRSSDGQVSLNHRVQLLGRTGVLGITMIAAPEDYPEAVAAFTGAMEHTTFVAGERYAEFREGDRVAEYGLTALIAGGAGAAAVKLGLFGKLWKVIAGFVVAAWKLLAVAVLAVAAKARALFGKKSGAAASPPSP